MSRGGHLSMVTSGTTLRPPVATTVSMRSATSSTSKGDGSSRRASSLSRVTENTSKGPQKSNTSTSGKVRMPTRLRSIDLSFWRSLEEGCVGLEPEEEATHRLEVRLPSLELLGHGVDVAEPAVERALHEDGGGPRRVVRHVGDRLRLMDGVGRGEPDEDALIEGEHTRVAHRAPDLVKRSQEEAARGSELRFRLRHLGLDDRVLGEGALEAPRRLLGGEGAEGIQHAARDAEGHPGEARGIERARGEAVERSGLAPLRGIVARDRVLVRDEDVGHREGVAARALEPAHVPHVHDLRLIGGDEQRSLDDLARTVSAERSVGLAEGRMPAEPRGVTAAAGEAPQAAETIAAIDGNRARVRSRAPGEH